MLVIIVGILVISLSLALGFIVFVGIAGFEGGTLLATSSGFFVLVGDEIAGFVLVMGIVMRVRYWWLGRATGGQKAAEHPGKPQPSGQPRIIEGEYQEVRKPGGPTDNG